MRRALLIVLACATSARADVTVDVTLTPDGQALARQLGLTTADLEQRVGAELDAVFATAHVPDLLRALSDASAFSARGLGVDYVSLPRGVLFGIAGTGAITTNDQLAIADRLTGGLVVDLAAMVGLNLARWGHPRWTLFANGYYQSDGTTALEANLASGGAHVQVAVIAPHGPHLLRWIGLDVTTGVELTRWAVGVSEPIEGAFEVGGGAQSAYVELVSTGRFELAATTTAIPFEVTTGVRLAGLLALYAGGGVDLDVGQATVAAQMTGPLSDAAGHMLGTLTIAGSDRRSGTPLVPRALGGAQLELGQVKVFAQVNAAESLASVGAGVRFVL